jgi:hypothetical protein
MGVRYSSSPSIETYKIRVIGIHYPVRYHPGHIKQALGLWLGQVMPPGDMSFGNNQTVPLGKGVDIQNTKRKVVFIKTIAIRFPRHNFTKHAGIGISSHNVSNLR